MIDGNICDDQPKIANYLCNNYYFANIAHGIGNTDGTSDDSFAMHAGEEYY